MEMDLVATAKILGVVATLLTIWFGIAKHRTQSNQVQREQYKFVNDHIDEIIEAYDESIEKIERGLIKANFIGAKGLRTIANSDSVYVPAIRHILNFSDSDRAIRLYRKCTSIVFFEEKDRVNQFVFRRRFNSHLDRKISSVTYFALYMLFGILAVSPWFIPTLMGLEVKTLIMSTVILFVFSSFFAWIFLDKYWALTSAEQLFCMQDEWKKLPANSILRSINARS